MVLVTTCISSDLVLAAIGLVNQYLLGQRLTTGTLFYFADARYLESVTFPWYARWRRWRPVLAGVFLQRSVGGLICVAGCTESQFALPEHEQNLRALHARMERMCRLLRVPTASYAGVLPGEFARLGIRRRAIEVERTVEWVGEALRDLLRRCSLTAQTPIVIVGAAGFVGQRLAGLLSQRHQVFMADPRLEEDCVWPREPAVLLNVSRGDAIATYADRIIPGSVVLNEVYPECSAETLCLLKASGARYFHIKGVAAKSYPRFPRAYEGAVPCCAASAALTPMGGDEVHETVVLVEL